MQGKIFENIEVFIVDSDKAVFLFCFADTRKRPVTPTERFCVFRYVFARDARAAPYEPFSAHDAPF